MYREILFKAKREDNGEWVEGWYHRATFKEELKSYIKHNATDNAEKIFMYDIDYEVNSDTLCQYTGLMDKNGKKIWENDIVLLREEIQDYEWKAEVKFGNPNSEYNWGWQLVSIGECDMNKDILLWIDMEIANCEVIGNIFDNIDLLEVE